MNVSADRKQLIGKLAAMGQTYREIERATGLQWTTVQRVLRRLRKEAAAAVEEQRAAKAQALVERANHAEG